MSGEGVAAFYRQLGSSLSTIEVLLGGDQA